MWLHTEILRVDSEVGLILYVMVSKFDDGHATISIKFRGHQIFVRDTRDTLNNPVVGGICGCIWVNELIG